MYTWQEPYLQAAQETDDSQIPHHLLEATAAIEQRLLSPIDEKSDEYRAIKNTWLGIQTLRKQHWATASSHHQ